jgi:hypothetical protein
MLLPFGRILINKTTIVMYTTLGVIFDEDIRIIPYVGAMPEQVINLFYPRIRSCLT